MNSNKTLLLLVADVLAASIACFTWRGTLIELAIWTVVVIGLFCGHWANGDIAALAKYVGATREELNKCTWPTWNELKGSTVVVMISIAILGAFTVAVDLLFTMLARTIT